MPFRAEVELPFAGGGRGFRDGWMGFLGGEFGEDVRSPLG